MFNQKNIILEGEVHPGGISNVLLFQDLLSKVEHSIVRIIIDNGYGTGFFCKIKEPKDEDRILKVLFTCNHVLKKEKLIKQKKIIIEINKTKKILDLHERRIWTNDDETLDYTCIEILKNDEIQYFLNIDENIIEYNYTIEKFKNKGIYVFGINLDLQLGFDKGYIYDVKNSLILHNCNTIGGYSGGAIINKNNNSVIAIHKGKNENESIKYNLGVFINSIINDIKTKNKYFKIDDNNTNLQNSQISNTSNIGKILTFQVIFKYYGLDNPQILRTNEVTTDILGYRVNLKLYYISGEDNFSTINYNNFHCIIYVYDISNKYNLIQIYNFLINFMKIRINNNILNILIGKEFNLGKQRQVSQIEGRNFANLNKMHFFEFSHSSNLKVFEFIAISLIIKYCNKELLSNDKIIEIYKPYLNEIFFNNDTVLINPINIYNNQTNFNPMIIIIKQMKESVCKIYGSKLNGTGFFCKIQNIKYGNTSILYVLITNNHILGEEDIKSNKKIKISLNNGNRIIEIIIDNSRKAFTSKIYDITIIEMKENDGIEKDSFIEIDKDIYKDNFREIYKNKSIYLLHYVKGIEIYKSESIIRNINESNYTIEYYCDSSYESSGGPLINLENYKVIGVHKGFYNNKINIGIIISAPIEKFYENLNNQFNMNKINKNNNSYTLINKNKEINEITIQYKTNYYDRNIRLFGENFVKNNKNLCKIIVENKEYDLCEYYSIKNLKLNNNKFEIKLKGIKNVTNMSYIFSDCSKLSSLPDISKWDTKNVTNMSFMFDGCSKLSVKPVFRN